MKENSYHILYRKNRKEERSMLNILWGAMILLAIITASLQGTMAEVNTAFIDSAKEGIELCIFMLGVIGMWSGFMKIAENAGLIETLSKKFKGIIRWMFPSIPKGHKAAAYIATNMIANMFGLGWAATPSGLLALKELDKLNGFRKEASDDMCTFLILNISSLQLIPINMIGYRSQYGSPNPSIIIIPALIATTVSTLVGVLYAKWKRSEKGYYK